MQALGRQGRRRAGKMVPSTRGPAMRKLATYLILLGSGLWVGWCASQAVSRGSALPRAVTPRGALPAAEQSVVDRFKEARVSGLDKQKLNERR